MSESIWTIGLSIATIVAISAILLADIIGAAAEVGAL